MAKGISEKEWGMNGGKTIFLYRMENSSGAYVELTNFGASIVSIAVPDRKGNLDHVVLGFPQIQGYLEDQCYIGATIGRYANRIAFANFKLDGRRHHLLPNDGPHANHGGTDGLDKLVFDVSINDNAISFYLTSPDGSGGFPGNLRLNVTYCWNEANELHIRYQATSDQKTVLNITNHAYFNLSGGGEDITSHRLNLAATYVLESGIDYIPTGALIPCEPPSFRRVSRGLNHCYVLEPPTKKIPRRAASLQHPATGRLLEVHTTYPGLVVYTSDFLSSSIPGNMGRPFRPLDGICLECQYFPDAPNHPAFPSTILDVGKRYDEQICFKFTVSPE